MYNLCQKEIKSMFIKLEFLKIKNKFSGNNAILHLPFSNYCMEFKSRSFKSYNIKVLYKNSSVNCMSLKNFINFISKREITSHKFPGSH